jgi:glycosyltransferase involved in cell wall biosynthesis
MMSAPSVSVIVPTFNRRAGCIRAVRSALAQTRPPLEVLVCDNGSTDDTRQAVEHLIRADDRVRFLGLATNTGSPAAPRNRGVDSARGGWVAFLDDDDEWLPEKLALQQPALSGEHSVVCANAQRSDGRAYFPDADGVITFDRNDLLRDNPVITSTAVVDRRRLLDAGGFPEDRRLARTEDYGAWLALADRGATGTRLPFVVARYGSGGADRLTAQAAASQRGVAYLALRRWGGRPLDRRLLSAAILHSARAAKLLAASARLRRSTADESTRS